MTSEEHGNTQKMAASESSSRNVYAEPSQANRLLDKAKQAPFVPIGIAGTLGVIGWGAYTYKKRGKMSTSIFLMHLRVKAQSVIVGAMTIGVAYSIFKDYILDKEKRDKYILRKDTGKSLPGHQVKKN